jgi:hypothetical protein
MKRAVVLGPGLWTAILLASGSGCGESGKPIPTDGLVTLDGKPVDGATVTFHPEAKEGRAATGLTDAEGVFQLQTFAEADGALPGAYKVTVVKTEAAAAPGPASGPEQMMKTMFHRKKKPSSLLPREYAEISRTPLRARVPEEKSPVKLELKRAGGS